MLQRLVWVYSCQNATLLEISCRGSFYCQIWYSNGSWVTCSYNTCLFLLGQMKLVTLLISINLNQHNKPLFLLLYQWTPFWFESNRLPKRYFFCGSFVLLWLVYVMLSRLFIAALWSPEGKGLTSWLLFVMLIVILLLSHLVSWDMCGTWLYRFLILAVFLTLKPFCYF